MKFRPIAAISISALLLLSACSHEPIRKTHTPYEEPRVSTAMRDDTIKKVQSLYQRGDYNNAMVLLEATSEKNIHPTERAEYNNLKGLIYLAQKKPLQSEAAFRKAIAINQTEEYSGYFKYNLATALYEGGKPDEAFSNLNEIDLASVDQTQRRKILILKERIASKKPADALTINTPKPAEITVTGSKSSFDTTTVNIPTPTDTYSGSVNKRRIGLLIPLSGKYETFGKKVQRSVELAFQHSADPRAKDYEIITEDSGDTTPSRLDALNKLVEKHEVIAIIGPLVSKGLETLAARAAYYQVPMISIAQAQGIASPHLFSCAISNRDQAARIVDYAMRTKGYSRFAILAPSNKPGEEMAHTIWDEVEARKGEITSFEQYNPEITDFREPVDKVLGLFYPEARSKELRELAEKRKELNITKKTMKTAVYFSLPPIINFDAVFIADEAKTVGQIIPTFAYRDARNIPFLGMTTWNSQQLIQRAQDQAEGATFPVAFNTLTPPPSTKNFYDLYTGTYSAYPGELDALAFDSAALVLKVLHDSPSSRDDFRKELENTRNIEAATGVVSMTDHKCMRKLDLYTVQKGKFVSVEN